MKYLHKYTIFNGQAVDHTDIQDTGKTIVYEVIRITEGIPMFLESHLDRIEKSVNLVNKIIPYTSSQFKYFIKTLVDLNRVLTGNIKISLEYDNNSEIVQSVVGFIPHSYPTVEEYRNGVKTISFVSKRNNPSAKIQNDKFRKELNEMMKKENAYEVILIHPDGYITEGSRSNLFFIQGNTIYTSPDDQVLSGITREKVIEICKNNYNLVLEPIPFSKLKHIDAAFITGTSPKILPIKSIDKNQFKLPNLIIEDLSVKFSELITVYLASHQKND